VPIPPDQPVIGVVLTDQLRCLSWPDRNIRIIGVAPAHVLSDVREKIAALIGIE
jgi:mRNA interferase MazF